MDAEEFGVLFGVEEAGFGERMCFVGVLTMLEDKLLSIGRLVGEWRVGGKAIEVVEKNCS